MNETLYVGNLSYSTTGDTLRDHFAAAVQVGFTRIQFTGGEPLLRPDVGAFVGLARRYEADVGVTTNRTYLPVRLEDLV